MGRVDDRITTQRPAGGVLPISHICRSPSGFAGFIFKGRKIRALHMYRPKAGSDWSKNIAVNAIQVGAGALYR